MTGARGSESGALQIAFKDPDLAGQFLRTLGYTYQRCADIGECFITAARIDEGDPASWYDEWNRTAERVRDRAASSLTSGHRVSAREGFLRASEYYRQSAFFLRGDIEDARVHAAAENLHACFGHAIALFDSPAAPVEIPYEGTTLPGYLFQADDGPQRKPTIVMPGGYDGFAEEGFSAGAQAALLRGYNFLVFDGPGQGHALLARRLFMRPDFEAVLTPVMDWLLAQPQVAQDEVVLLGRSFGGYLAPRAACSENRLAALVCDPGQLDLAAAMRARLPPQVVAWLRSQDANAVNEYFQDLFTKTPNARFFFTSRMHVHGVGTVYDYLREMERYQFTDRVQGIACPTLVCDNPTDRIAIRGKGLYDALSCEKTYLLFNASEGAGAHCEAGAAALFEQQVFDWIDAVIARKRG